jgi:hypothetical protein
MNSILFDLNCLGSPQGRIGAFNHADLEKGYEILREHFAFSTNFKTVLQYGQQPMTTSETSLELLDLFLGVARPQLMEGPKDPLFISLTGTPLRFGRLVTDFFKRITDLHISVTTIRAVVATGAVSLRGNGVITNEQLEGVSNTSGHKGETVHKYYQKQDRTRDMHNATTVHRKLLNPAHLEESTIDVNILDCGPFMSRSPIIDDAPLVAFITSAYSDNLLHPLADDAVTLHTEPCAVDVTEPSHCDQTQSPLGAVTASIERQAPQSPLGAAIASIERQAPQSPLGAAIASIERRAPQAWDQTQSPLGAAIASIERRAPQAWDQTQPPLGAVTASIERRAPPAWTVTQPIVASAVSSVGLLHPSIADSGRKIPWTETEINIVGTWCERYKALHPDNTYVVAGCLRYILNDSDVRRHFHPHHLMDSARLRWGWKRYRELEQESSNVLDLL